MPAFFRDKGLGLQEATAVVVTAVGGGGAVEGRRNKGRQGKREEGEKKVGRKGEEKRRNWRGEILRTATTWPHASAPC